MRLNKNVPKIKKKCPPPPPGETKSDPPHPPKVVIERRLKKNVEQVSDQYCMLLNVPVSYIYWLLHELISPAGDLD